MSQKISLNIGLNDIDAKSYQGTYKTLRNAENDANFYFDIAKSCQFNSIKLLGCEATSLNVLKYLKDYAKILVSGDMLFFTYSGHGTRVEDVNGDEDDQCDEALVLYDRLFIDDEFQLCWAKFNEGVRILFISDSCHNGTVSRFFTENERTLESIWSDRIVRGVEMSESAIDFERNLSYYKGIKLGINSNKARCSIIHIGACQDNQTAEDGSHTDINGRFTSALRQIYNDGNFMGSNRELYENIRNNMPPWQTPNWDVESGINNEQFAKSQFLIG